MKECKDCYYFSSFSDDYTGEYPICNSPKRYIEQYRVNGYGEREKCIVGEKSIQQLNRNGNCPYFTPFKYVRKKFWFIPYKKKEKI